MCYLRDLRQNRHNNSIWQCQWISTSNQYIQYILVVLYVLNSIFYIKDTRLASLEPYKIFSKTELQYAKHLAVTIIATLLG